MSQNNASEVRHVARPQKKRKTIGFARRAIRWAFALTLFATLAGGAGVWLLYRHIEPQLPDIEVLSDVRYQIPMSVYSRDGKLIGQFGEKKRNPISIDDAPAETIQAFLAAEDDRFFDHPGVDYQGLLRAAYAFAATGEKRQGGSTITMQVARNFFLSSEKTFFRKIKEILLAVKIESKLPKRKILELYLNKIYFGHHAYGVEAAAQTYFGKRVTELTLAETAMIAGLPKAPSAYNPIANPERALTRRDYVLKRMFKLGFIDAERYRQAVEEPVRASVHTPTIEFDAPYVAEMARNEMYQKYGENAYDNGYKVFTTLDSRLQAAADRALRQCLHEYDERHGFRGAKRRIDLKKLKTDREWDQELTKLPERGDTAAGIVLAVKERSAEIYLGSAGFAELNWDAVKWARKYIRADSRGAPPRIMRDVIDPGDIVRLRLDEKGEWRLAQAPEVEGALAALDPSDGAILAVAGGFDYARSKFNRATQSQRQPGSGFKPILYAAALEAGFTPASVIVDAPIVFRDPSMAGGAWKPQNYSGRFYGPTRLREALVKSRNLVSIRLLREIGLDKAIETAKRFGFGESDLPRSLSLALGSGSATPLKMAEAFAVFANGGFHVEPYLIERIENQDGAEVFRQNPKVACLECESLEVKPANLAPRVISPQVHYMMNSMLQDVIRYGTATPAMVLGRGDIAGKTGTTNEQRDAWFNGYAPSLVASTWLGFDSFRPLGDGETGGHSSLPMWIHFMKEALENQPETAFSLPEGLVASKISPHNGLLAPKGSANGITEYFPPDRVPKRYSAPAKRAPQAEPADDGGGSDEDGGGENAPPEDEPAGSGGGKAGDSLF